MSHSGNPKAMSLFWFMNMNKYFTYIKLKNAISLKYDKLNLIMK